MPMGTLQHTRRGRRSMRAWRAKHFDSAATVECDDAMVCSI